MFTSLVEMTPPAGELGGCRLGAAQVGTRGGIKAGTIMEACDTCTWVNGKFGVGYRDNASRPIPPDEPR